MDNKKVRKNTTTPSKASNRKGPKMRPVPTIRIFGYGSLLNLQNIRTRFSGKARFELQSGKLTGYQRTFSKWGRGHVYLTLREMQGTEVEGMLIDVNPIGFAILTRHEPGYELVDVTRSMVDYPSDSPRVYCYIGDSLKEIPPEIAKIRRSYLNMCLGGVAPEKHKQWLRETHIPEGVVIAEED